MLMHMHPSAYALLIWEEMAPGCTVVSRQGNRGSVMLWKVFSRKTLGGYFDIYHLPNIVADQVHLFMAAVFPHPAIQR